MWRAILLAALLHAGAIGAAFAGDDLRPDERDAVLQALYEIGCEAREIELDDGIFEVNDARCRGGIYDIELDENLDIIEMNRD